MSAPGDFDGGRAAVAFGDRMPLAVQYADILGTQGVEWGLLGPREPDRLWNRHLLNSVALASVVPTSARVLDVGSGAGLPGIPVAIARPDLKVTLLEPLLRRFRFLGEVVGALNLADQVDVVRGRAEEWTPPGGRYDAVVSRAVAPLPKLVRVSRALKNRTGEILALKGDRAESELRESEAVLRGWGLSGVVVEVRACASCDPTWVVRVRSA